MITSRLYIGLYLINKFLKSISFKSSYYKHIQIRNKNKYKNTITKHYKSKITKNILIIFR